MDLNEILDNTLKETGLEVEQDEYTGNQEKYIIYTYEDERPTAFGNNRPYADTTYLQIQLITPKEYKYITLKHKIRNLLEEADFLVKSTRSFLGSEYVGTEKIRQTVFQAEYTEQRKKEK